MCINRPMEASMNPLVMVAKILFTASANSPPPALQASKIFTINKLGRPDSILPGCREPPANQNNWLILKNAVKFARPTARVLVNSSSLSTTRAVILVDAFTNV